MASEIVAGAVAAGVSVVVAVATVTVTYVTTRASLRRDHERQEAEFMRTMTVRLYDRRVAVYPGLFAATDAFRRSRLDGAHDLRDHLGDAIARVDEWHGQQGGLLLSANAHGRLLDLRRTVRVCIEETSDDRRVAELKHEIWSCKNELRKAMRADLGLLFDEDQR